MKLSDQISAGNVGPEVVELVRMTDDHKGLKRYHVFVGDRKIGAVEQYLPTFEREIKGKRYVASRWTSKHPRWVALPEKSVSWNPYRCWMSTRKEAITALLRALGE